MERKQNYFNKMLKTELKIKFKLFPAILICLAFLILKVRKTRQLTGLSSATGVLSKRMYTLPESLSVTSPENNRKGSKPAHLK